MNWNEIDIMKLTPEDYLKMRDRCRELEDEKKQQADYILELRTELERLRAAARDTQKRVETLKYERDHALECQGRQYDYIQELKNQTESPCENCICSAEEVAKDADAKIQSANDRAANAKKEAKAAKERAESASERVRYLERKLRDVGSLNDSLMKELANRQGCHVFSADAYQKSVMRYASPAIAKGGTLSLIYGVVGMCGEAGEASELVKKNAFHGHTLDCKHLASELGDVLWYIAYTADDLGYSLSAIMAMNQEKLAKRYPNGKFEAERSRHREEGDI